jgi:fructokinase
MGRVTYAVVLGEALIDLLETELHGERVFRQAVGGAPLNVATGVARLGEQVEFLGSVGSDAFADRIVDFLAGAGVRVGGVVRVAVPTTLGVASFRGAEPEFTFYGEPPSYSLIRPTDLDPGLVTDARVFYCGSIFLLRESGLLTARQAWAQTAGLRVFDPNVRPTLLPDGAALIELRDVVEEFVASAHLAKVSAADAEVLYGTGPEDAADRFLALGAGAVVVTRGAKGALVACGRDRVTLAAPQVNAVDATGAGDSVMGALIAGLLRDGLPYDVEGWAERTVYALRVAGLVCESPGGAVSMPTREQVAARFAGA